MPYVGATNQNNGVLRFVEYKETLVTKGKCIAFICDGDGSIGYSMYKEEDFIGSVTVKVGRNENLNKRTGLFISAVSDKIRPYYSFALKRNEERLKSEILLLPITSSSKIDFAFMKTFIAELEAELEAYLLATGLKNHKLTKEEKEALAYVEKCEWGEFRLGELFEKIETKSLMYKARALPKTATTSNPLPALTSGTQNQGLTCFVPKENTTILKNVISIASNGAAGTTYYQSQEFTILQDAYAIEWIYTNDVLSDKHYLFLASAISKQTVDSGKYGWDYKANWTKVKHEKIQLPITSSGEIDYAFMETFIRAVQKLVIKDVVLYTDRKIEATKKVVNG